jgi:hypothetical protein
MTEHRADDDWAAFPALCGPEQGFVFVVTYGRSGSTLIQNLLNALPGYCIRGENGDLSGPLAQAWHLAANTDNLTKLRKSGRTTDPTHPWFGAEGIAPDRLGRALADAFCREVLHPPKGTRVAGFKEIRFHRNKNFFTTHLAFLRQCFPNARFVFNTRRHENVARSGWWAEQDPERVIRVLAQADELFDTFLEAQPDICCKLRYEDYDGQPEGFRPLFDFLGEPFEPDLAARILETRLSHLK